MFKELCTSKQADLPGIVVERQKVIIIKVMKAKPGKNNLIFIALRFGLGHWECWTHDNHFLVAMPS